MKISCVPHLEGLTIKECLAFAKERPHILEFLPDESDWAKVDRQWLCDILYTQEKDSVQELIDRALRLRKISRWRSSISASQSGPNLQQHLRGV